MPQVIPTDLVQSPPWSVPQVAPGELMQSVPPSPLPHVPSHSPVDPTHSLPRSQQPQAAAQRERLMVRRLRPHNQRGLKE